MGSQYAQLSKSLIRDARRNLQAQITSLSRCIAATLVRSIRARMCAARRFVPTTSTRSGSTIQEGTRTMVEALTRPTVGTDECPIEGIPNQKTAAHR
jgi:amidase